MKDQTCDTIGCRATATHLLTWYDRVDEQTYTDKVCEPCGDSFMRRPVLRATLAPLNGGTVSLKKWYAIAATPDGRWGVQQAPGVFVFISDYRNGLGTTQCRRWRLRKANGFNLN